MNPTLQRTDKKGELQRNRFLRHLLGCMGWCGVLSSGAFAAEPAAPIVPAEAAAIQLAKGDFPGAAKLAQQALEAAPDGAPYLALAGAILLQTGDWRGAQTHFSQAVARNPQESVAHYGLGLTYLAQGSRVAAQRAFQTAEQNGGDVSCLLIARRYAQWLEGAQVAVSEAGVPGYLAPAALAMEGMSAVRRGDRGQAIRALTEAQETLEGDPMRSPFGALMTFEPGRPLLTTARPLNKALGLQPNRKQDALSGEIQFAPEAIPAHVGYVAYELNGESLGLVNVRPFSYVWDSRQAPNGTHTISIILYDRGGRELDRVTRQVRIYNAGKSATAADAGRLAQLRATLWQSLSLRPDRAACAYTLGAVYRLQSSLSEARTWFLRAAALRPNYRDTREQLKFCGGVAAPSEAIYGGVPTEKVIALTFDDGPKPGMTEPLLDMLVQERVPATFFVIGRHVTAHPELTRKLFDAGMELANHSYTHPNLTRLSEAEIAEEMLQTQAAIHKATGKTPRYMRPPGGNWSPKVSKVCREWGIIPAFWTVDVYGSEVVGTQQVADAVLQQVRPGSIVLMHNGKMSTLQALPTIIRELRRQGYLFVTVEALHRRLKQAKEAELVAIRNRALANPRRGE